MAQAIFNSEAAPAGDNPFVWTEKVKFKPSDTPKPDRRRTSRRKESIRKGIEEAPRLTLKYQVLKLNEDGAEQAIDPRQALKTGEQVKLALTANQNGFLYIIHQSKAFNGIDVVDQPRLIFPDPRINSGKNEIEANVPYTVPSICNDPENPEKFQDPENCWLEITPPGGKEVFTVIFSRDELTNLPKIGSVVAPDVIEKIKLRSSKSIVPIKSTDPLTSYLQNNSLKDNEEIFTDIELTHVTKEKDDPAARARALFVKKASDAMQIRILKDGEPVDPSTEFKAGDKIRVWFESNFKGYVYIVNVTPKGQRCLLVPCSANMSNSIDVDQRYILPSENHDIVFDNEKGVEVLQVIMSRERISYLDAAVKDKDCCNGDACCQLSASAMSAAEELASSSSKQQVGGITAENLVPTLARSDSGGIRARGIILAAGKNKSKGSTFVAIDDGNASGNTLKAGQAAVFVIRLKHS